MSRQVVLDSHHHLWDTNDGEYPWMVGELAALRGVHDMNELTPLLQENNVESTVAVQVRADIGESVTLLWNAATHREIVGVVGWVDLTSPHVGRQIDALQTSRGGECLVGIRHAVADEADPRWLERDDVVRGLGIVRDAGLTFDLEVTERELPAAVAVADRIPDLPLVVDHLAKPSLRGGIHQRWMDQITVIAARSNVMAKVSGLVTEADWDRWTVRELQVVVDIALDLFGPNRLMFGSDWPVCELAASYDEVLASAEATIAALSPRERAQILSESAHDFYKIPARVQSN